MGFRIRTGASVLLGLALASLAGAASATTWNVPPAGDLQGAINAAQPGDTIQVAAGATYTGSFNLPVKSGADYITIRSAALDANLPAAGHRIDPSYSPALPRLVSPGSNLPVIRTAPSTHHWRLQCLEISPDANDDMCTDLVQLGDGNSTQNDVSLVPHDLIVDRCYIHGHATNDIVRRGVSLQCGYAEVRNCWISDIHGTLVDTQAIAGWNGPGPFVIDNNELEASGENILFGGADPGIPNLVPSDITITNNHMFKPLSWRVGDPSYAGIHWEVKNLFEIKNAQRLTVDHNLFENCWSDAQTGYALNWKSSNQNGAATWDVCQNLTFTNNIVRHAGGGVKISRDPLPVILPNNIIIRNNLFDDISSTRWGGDGGFLQIADASFVTVDHNTAFQEGLVVLPYDTTGNTMTNFTFTNNLVPHNAYGVKAGGVSPGTATLNAFWVSTWVFRNNVIEGIPAAYSPSLYPANNFWPAGWTNVGFVDMASGNYALADTSPYKSAGSDGADVGCSFASVPPPARYTISGKVASGTVGLAGVTLTDGVSSTTTASDGTYTLTGLLAGSYPVSGWLNGYTLSGPQTVKVGPNATGINFTATASILGSEVITSPTIKSGAFTSCKVTLTAPAPAGGAVVKLSSSISQASVPSSITIPAGQTTATFTVTTISGQQTRTAMIYATYKVNRIAMLTMTAATSGRGKTP